MILITIVSLFILTLPIQNNSQNNYYDVLRVIEKVEIRKYNTLLYVSYIPIDESDRSNSFRQVADFIFGNNSKNETISMTSPVVMKTHNNYEMAFIMPNNYTIENLPKPNNDNLNIYEENGVTKACITYSGFSNKSKEKKYIAELKKILKNYNIKYLDDFEVLIYNAPYQLINRKNEITVSVVL